MPDIDLKALARLGAQARLAELIAEMDAILAAFPDLGRAPARPGRPAPAAWPVRKRRRFRMTAAQRKEVSARMRKYWAERRRAKK